MRWETKFWIKAAIVIIILAAIIYLAVTIAVIIVNKIS